MAGIPKFDEKTARRLFEIHQGTKEEKAAAVVRFYGIEGGVNFNSENGAYRSHGDFVSFIGSIVEDIQRVSSLAIGGTSYEGVEFEPRAHRKDNSNEKQLFTFDKSQERIIALGPEYRHARPQEVFGLIIGGLEGRLSLDLKDVYDDLFKSYGEFLGEAVERKGNTLICYLDPEGLVWNGSIYVKKDFKFAEQKEFDITGKRSQRYIDLKEFDNEFVESHYTRKFSELPEKMQVGCDRAQVYLPSEGTIWPVGRGYWFSIDGCNYGSWASRGVRKKIP